MERAPVFDTEHFPSERDRKRLESACRSQLLKKGRVIRLANVSRLHRGARVKCIDACASSCCSPLARADDAETRTRSRSSYELAQPDVPRSRHRSSRPTGAAGCFKGSLDRGRRQIANTPSERWRAASRRMSVGAPVAMMALSNWRAAATSRAGSSWLLQTVMQ